MILYTDGTVEATRAQCESAIVTIDEGEVESAKRTEAKNIVQAYIDAEPKLAALTVTETIVGGITGHVVVTFPTDPSKPLFFLAASTEIVNVHGGHWPDPSKPYEVCQDAIRLVGSATAWDEDNNVTEREGGHLGRIAAAL